MSAQSVARLPVDAKARRERRLTALWSDEDRLLDELRQVREAIRPLQREVSLDRGYLFTVSREKLQMPGRAG